MIVDGLGNPVSFLLSGGQVHDSKMAIPLMETINIAGNHVIADRAYGTRKIRTYIEKKKANYVISPKKCQNSMECRLVFIQRTSFSGMFLS